MYHFTTHFWLQHNILHNGGWLACHLELPTVVHVMACIHTCTCTLFQGFFDEIEDIKFALKQSAKLNKEYERSLRKVCQQFGVPYPHPEKKVLGGEL